LPAYFIDKGHAATRVSSRLGVVVGLIYSLACKLNEPEVTPIEDVKALQAEMTKLKKKLSRTTEEREILKIAASYFAKVSERSKRLSNSIARSSSF
jgi:transposase